MHMPLFDVIIYILLIGNGDQLHNDNRSRTSRKSNDSQPVVAMKKQVGFHE